MSKKTYRTFSALCAVLLSLYWVSVEYKAWTLLYSDPELCTVRIDLTTPMTDAQAQMLYQYENVTGVSLSRGSHYVEWRPNKNKKAEKLVLLSIDNMSNSPEVKHIAKTAADFPESFDQWVIVSKAYQSKHKLKIGDSITVSVNEDNSRLKVEQDFTLKINAFYDARRAPQALISDTLARDLVTFKTQTRLKSRDWLPKGEAFKAINTTDKTIAFTKGDVQVREHAAEGTSHTKVPVTLVENAPLFSTENYKLFYLNMFEPSDIDQYFLITGRNPTSIKHNIERTRDILHAYRVVFAYHQPIELIINGKKMKAIPYDGRQDTFEWPRYNKHLKVKVGDKLIPYAESIDEEQYWRDFFAHCAMVSANDMTIGNHIEITVPGTSLKMNIKNALPGRLYFENQPEFECVLLSYPLFWGIKGYLEKTHEYDQAHDVFYRHTMTLESHSVDVRVNDIRNLNTIFPALDKHGDLYHKYELVNDVLTSSHTYNCLSFLIAVIFLMLSVMTLLSSLMNRKAANHVK